MQTLILILIAILLAVVCCNLYFTYAIAKAFKEEHKQNEFLWGSYDALKYGVRELYKLLNKQQKSGSKREDSSK